MYRLAAVSTALLTWAVVGLGSAYGGPRSTVVSCGLAVCACWAVAGARLGAEPGAGVPALAGGALSAAVALAAPGVVPSGDRVATAASLLAIAAGGHWLLGMPGGRLTDPGRRSAVAAGYLAAVVASVVLVSADDPLTAGAAALVATGGVAVALIGLRRRYLTGRAPDRDGLRWLAAGVLAGVTAIVPVAALHVILAWPASLWPTIVSAGAVPAVVVYAGRARLAEGLGGRFLVDVLSVLGFVIVISAVYIVLVRGLGQAPVGTAGRESVGLSMIAAGVAAISFGPARRRLVTRASRLVLGDRPRPDDLVRAFGSRLSRSMPLEDLLIQLAESLVRSFDLVRADLYTGSGDEMERVAFYPDRPGASRIPVSDRERPAVVRAGVSGNAWIDVWLPALHRTADDGQLRVAPIRNAGELLGLLVVERAASAEPFSEDEDRILGDLAREVGLALQNVQLDAALQQTLADLRTHAAELRRSRARIVASGDAVRRRVERDLHDGAQQSLVALAIGLRLARSTVERDPAAAARMLDDMNADVQTAVGELRELAHGIYPPLLADEGLESALKLAGARSQMVVTVEVAAADRFTQEIEAAVYFCCLEALQNASKHASGASVAIRVWCEGPALMFRIVDDGPGFDPARTTHGHGLVNMSDRVGAIGGTVAWRSQPGRGVEVTGSVPVTEAGART
ncbi:MAG TPA: histidine kinase [Acidimicrobiales bacterium]|jgi:signal transduction histidine kinase|nr:histidine kinase [Acidimicrobiales bacterium]